MPWLGTASLSESLCWRYLAVVLLPWLRDRRCDRVVVEALQASNKEHRDFEPGEVDCTRKLN